MQLHADIQRFTKATMTFEDWADGQTLGGIGSEGYLAAKAAWDAAYAAGAAAARRELHTAPPTDGASTADLDARMVAAGMVPLSELLENIPLEKWQRHVGVTDLKSFEDWLHMRRGEMLRMQAYMDLEKRTEDDMFEWVLAHNAVLTEVICNFRAVTGSLQSLPH